MHGGKADRGGAKLVRRYTVKQADADTTKAVPAKSAAMKLAAANCRAGCGDEVPLLLMK
jgi:hypothetical protein